MELDDDILKNGIVVTEFYNDTIPASLPEFEEYQDSFDDTVPMDLDAWDSVHNANTKFSKQSRKRQFGH